MLNYFSISGLCISIINLCLAVLISQFGKLRLHKVWSFVNYSISLWGFGMFISGSTQNHEIAFIGWRIFNVGIILIAVIYYHVIHLFCNLQSKKFLIFSYIQGLFFIGLTIFTNLMFGDKLAFSFGQFYYFRAGISHHVLMFIWTIIVGDSFYELYKYIRESQGIVKIQGKYLFVAMMFGFGGGLNTAPAAWGFNIYPYGQILVCVYGLLATYAIFKYHIMDIRVAFTRLGVFVAVYSIVLGIPFGLVIWARNWLTIILGQEWFWLPMISLLLLATAGPFIYLYFQRRAESALLQEERRLQDLLNRASMGMRTIRNLPKLLELIVDILAKSLRLDNAAVYLHDPMSNQFILNVSRRGHSANLKLDRNDPLILRLEETKYPLVYEELKLSSESQNKDENLREIVRQMGELQASVIVPMVVENILLGFIVLGERKDKRIYSTELINVLLIVGNQAALAIENAMFYIEREKLLHENFERRRFESLGTLTNSISHQMSNRFHAIMQRLAIVWDICKEGQYKEFSREKLIEFIDSIRESIERVLAIAEDGGKVTDAIQNYSKGKIEVGPVNFDASVDRSIEFVRLKHTKFTFEVKKEYPKEVFLWGAQALIQDIIANAVDNSCYAMKMKKKDDDSYMPEVVIRGQPNKTMFEFEIEDNGIGIRKENLNKVMDPMYSTRSHLEGTGMGTTIMLQFVQKHGGIIVYDSEWGTWTKVKISLPLANEDQIKGIKESE